VFSVCDTSDLTSPVQFIHNVEDVSS
jgi:hypothetical protein